MQVATPEARFIERIVSLLERQGLPSALGRIFGALLLTDDMISQDDLAARVGLSKAAVSVSARFLVLFRMIEVARRPGDRRVYYRVHPDLWGQRLALIRVYLRELIVDMEEVQPFLDAERPHAARRIRQGLILLRRFEGAIEEIEAAWRAELREEGPR